MGRGRAKAKQTKVARELKYSTGGTDLDRLRAELGASTVPAVGSSPVSSDPAYETDDDETDDDPYAEYATYALDDEDELED